MRSKGKIIHWDDEKGFGFIKSDTGGKDIFVHIKSIKGNCQRPAINQLVSYTLSTNKQGKPCAIKVTLTDDCLATKHKSGSRSIITPLLYLVIVEIAVLIERIPVFILIIYLVVSLFTFIVYALDKRAAKQDRWRTSENRLHLLALCGGWPGAIIAQHKLHHKSSKQPFRLIFGIIVLLNCAAFVWLFSPSGIKTIEVIEKNYAKLIDHRLVDKYH
jgi:uncharacterized membrane protein YsdA (DUF1294 family)/cold shock CspA family protein